MPDSLESTLPAQQFHPSSESGSMTSAFVRTSEQAVQYLSSELGQPTVLMATGKRSKALSLEQLDFSNSSHVYGCTDNSVLTGVSKYPTKPM